MVSSSQFLPGPASAWPTPVFGRISARTRPAWCGQESSPSTYGGSQAILVFIPYCMPLYNQTHETSAHHRYLYIIRHNQHLTLTTPQQLLNQVVALQQIGVYSSLITAIQYEDKFTKTQSGLSSGQLSFNADPDRSNFASTRSSATAPRHYPSLDSETTRVIVYQNGTNAMDQDLNL